MSGPVIMPPDFSAFISSMQGKKNIVSQPLYDYQTYAQAGQTQLNFFQVPVGQSSKTLADTNMSLAGSLPNPVHMLVTGLEIAFWPTGDGDPAAFGAQAAQEFINSVYDVMRTGWLEFSIAGKTYLTDGPIGVFPCSFRVGGFAALSDTTTAGADAMGRIGYASSEGAPYVITPVTIPPSQNFKVSLNWPTAQAIAAAGRIGVRLKGWQAQAVQ